MADPVHLERIRDVAAWNGWRQKNPSRTTDLSRANLSRANLGDVDLGDADLRAADLSRANLSGADLSGTDLSRTDLSRANLRRADLRRADLNRADLNGASLRRANLTGANLRRAYLPAADLSDANLSHANLSGGNLSDANLSRADLNRANLRGAYLLDADLGGADLSGADLSRLILVGTKLQGANLTSARVYGVSVWDVTGDPAAQSDLIITPPGEAEITVDDLKIAQFIHLLLNNAEIRNFIDTVARKAVLILGRFTPERKAILDGLRVALRENNYAPILFDFDKPVSRDLTETVRTLAHLSRFIIADLTDPAGVPHELQAIVPDLAVPVVPILSGDTPYGMFVDLQRKYHWVLDIHRYDDQQDLLNSLFDRVIGPAEAKAHELST